jgi:hypothetical protein
MTDSARARLRDHLVAGRLAGDVATGRASNVGNIRRMLDRDPEYTFGLELDRPWTFDEVLGLMAKRVGISADPGHTVGSDTIDPDLTLDALDAMAARLQRAAARQERVLLGSGHPTGMLAVHLDVAAALRRAGCALLTPGEGTAYTLPGGARRQVRYLGDVAVVSTGAELYHTHSGVPMAGLIEILRSAGEPLPDLVVGDHGWCGAAGQAGIDAVGFADCNDPALFVGEAEGKVVVSVPIDDNVLPTLYRPVSDYLVAGID